MVTSHDRAFLNRVVDKVLAIEPAGLLHHGNYDSYVIAKQKKMEQLEASAKRQERRIEKEERFIERFRYKARKASQVQSRKKNWKKYRLSPSRAPLGKSTLLSPNRRKRAGSYQPASY